jgi:hypothetical protein
MRRAAAPTTVGALLLVAFVLGCGGGGSKGSPKTTAKTTATATATAPATDTGAGPTPKLAFSSPHRYGYWFLGPPLVVKRDADVFTLYMRLNRRLPGGDRPDASATVDGTFGGFGLGATGFGDDRKACYAESMDIVRRATVAPTRVKVGDEVVVRLYLPGHRTPIEVRVPLSPRSPDEDDVADAPNLYLRQIGCERAP